MDTVDAKSAHDAIISAKGLPAAEIGPAIGTQRADRALNVRIAAARFEREQPLPGHPDNGDEALYPNKIASYSKALPHNGLGEVDLLTGLGQNQRLSGFQYKFGNGTGNPVVTVSFIGQTSGTVSTG